MAVAREGPPPLAARARARAAVAPDVDRARPRGCAAPALVVGGVVSAAIVAGFGLLLGSLPGGPPSWPLFLGAVAVLAFFWFFARTMFRGARPRHATGLELQVERQALRRGDRVAAVATGEGELEVGLLCTQSYDLWRRIANDSRSRVTDSVSVWQQWVPAPHAALGRRVELALPADGPYSYEATRLLRLGGRGAPRGREARGRAGAPVGRAVRARMAEPVPLGRAVSAHRRRRGAVAPGAAVSGRVVVEEGGRARSLSVRLAFVERTESFERSRATPGRSPRRGRPLRRRRRRLHPTVARRRRAGHRHPAR